MVTEVFVLDKENNELKGNRMSQHDFKKQSNEAPTGNTTHRGTHPSARGNNNQRSHLTRNALLNGSSERSTKVTEAFNKFLKILVLNLLESLKFMMF